MIKIIHRAKVKIRSFRALTKYDILESYISDHAYRSFHEGDEFGFDLFVFDIRYQENFAAAQPIKVEFNFDAVLPNDINGYALVLTTKLLSMSSDGQRHLDPI